jgi:hypothetical protein
MRALVAMLSAMPAAADHCPPGQFYRVRLNQCVGLNTRLASAYVHAAALRLATPGSGDKTALPVEPEAKPVGEPKIVIPFVLPTLNDWPPPKLATGAARPPSRKWPERAIAAIAASGERVEPTEVV